MVVNVIHIPKSNKKFFLDHFVDSSTGTATRVFYDLGGFIQTNTDQSWFWSEEWQSGEKEVEEYIEKGEVETFNSMEDFLRTLQE
jgi:hypothetical protein